MSKKSKKEQENLFISTQQTAQQQQIEVPNAVPLTLNLENIFSCPIYRAKKPEWVDSLNKASDPIIERLRKNWKKKIKDPKDPTKKMPNSLHSELLWNYPEFKDIANLILQQSFNIMHQQGYNLKDRIPMLTELWVQEFPEEGGFHDIHEHGNNHISGFYFLKCNEQTSHPVFWDPRPGKKMTDLMMLDEKKLNYGSQQVHYKVKPGDFIFFNSYMPHSYLHHQGKDKFRFIHFNTQIVINPKASGQV